PITHAQLSNQTNHTHRKRPLFLNENCHFLFNPFATHNRKTKIKLPLEQKFQNTFVTSFYSSFIFFFFPFFDNQFIPCSLMCMNRPNYSMPEMPAPTTTMNTIELNSTTTSSTTTRDLEKQQPLQPHQEKQIAGRTPSLYKILISLNLFSILVLGLIYYFIEFHPNFSTNLNELLYKMEKCNDL
ncbi:MAG: hypothetical protein M5F18_10110, partial [Asgard group archaeon]|nr:hypothetical protein [Asgard group archaeon]